MAWTDEFRERLLARRRDLVGRTGELEEEVVETAGSTDVEMEERAQADHESDVLLTLDERGREELLAIDAALQRIADGTYGQCEICGEPIPRGRLEALPMATTHVECVEGRARAAG